jgi:hypothetical protein
MLKSVNAQTENTPKGRLSLVFLPVHSCRCRLRIPNKPDYGDAGNYKHAFSHCHSPHSNTNINTPEYGIANGRSQRNPNRNRRVIAASNTITFVYHHAIPYRNSRLPGLSHQIRFVTIQV